MVVLVLFGPILCIAVPMLAVAIAMIVYIVTHYCMSIPLSRHSQQEDDEAGMEVVSKEEAAEETDNREGKQIETVYNLSCLTEDS